MFWTRKTFYWVLICEWGQLNEIVMMVLKKTAFPFSLQFFNAFFLNYIFSFMIHWLFFKTVYVPVCGSLGYVGSKHECTGTRTGSQALIKMHYRNEMLQFSISCVVQNPFEDGAGSLCHRSGVVSCLWLTVSGETHQPPSCCRSPLENILSLASVFPRFHLFRKRIQIKAPWRRLNMSNSCQGNLSFVKYQITLLTGKL